jgi:flagellar protein FliS
MERAFKEAVYWDDSGVETKMSYANVIGAANKYKQVGTQTEAMGAGPYRLVQMLMEGALSKIAIAKEHIGRGAVAQKAQHIQWAVSIIGALQDALDTEGGGPAAKNLDTLYDYMQLQLFKANLRDDPDLLDEVTKLLTTIKSGWDAMPEQLREFKDEAAEATAESAD